MNATNKLLDKYRNVCKAVSDKAIAERLKVTQGAISNWRNGRAHPDADSVEKMALAIGDLPGPWLANIEADRARSPAARMVWLRLAQTFGVTVALALILSLPSHAAHATTATAQTVALQSRHLHQWLAMAWWKLTHTWSIRHALRGATRPV